MPNKIFWGSELSCDACWMWSKWILFEFYSVKEQYAKPYAEIPGPRELPIIGNSWRFAPIIGDYSIVKTLITNPITLCHWYSNDGSASEPQIKNVSLLLRLRCFRARTERRDEIPFRTRVRLRKFRFVPILQIARTAHLLHQILIRNHGAVSTTAVITSNNEKKVCNKH
jgi:hypothetical protein